jgi:molybdate transport repressor ModE-like protein
MLDTRRLEILCAVARTGSLAGAARELSYSTPAVWQHMRRLEVEAGTPLLVPHARGVSLTVAGRILVRHGEQVARRLRQAEDELGAVRRLESGELRIAAFATAGSGLLPGPIARFRDAHPGVRVALSESEPDQALARLRHGEVDLAVVFAYDGALEESDTLEVVHLLDDPLYVIVPARHPLAAAKAVTPQQLRAEPWLQGSFPLPGSDGDAPPLAAAGDELAYRGGDFLTVQRLVGAGAGLALVPRLALDRIDTDIVARPLAGTPHSRRVLVAMRRTSTPDITSRRFAELLHEAASRLQEPAPSPD